jgi:carbonic anhydrase
MSDSNPPRDQTAVQQLLSRYKTFRKDVYPHHRELFESLAQRQEPSVLFITCSDSRIVPDLIMQSDPGDLFVCRNAGNIVPAYGEMTGGVSATVEYAVAVLKVKAIVVCGHSDCGAMKALLNPEAIAELPTVKVWLRHSELALRIVRDHYPDSDPDSLLEALIEENVVAQIEHIETHPYVSSQVRRGELAVYGWVYKIRTGEIVGLDPEQGKFVPLGDTIPTATQPPRRLIR